MKRLIIDVALITMRCTITVNKNNFIVIVAMFPMYYTIIYNVYYLSRNQKESEPQVFHGEI